MGRGRRLPNGSDCAFQVYPLEAEYTVVRSVDLWNNGSGNGHLEESIPLPMDVTSNEGGLLLCIR